LQVHFCPLQFLADCLGKALMALHILAALLRVRRLWDLVAYWRADAQLGRDCLVSQA
jgi:hypothetical protein